MSATYTLASTTLVNGIGRDDDYIMLASTAGIQPALNTHLYIVEFNCPGELCEVLGFGPVSGLVRVKRGIAPSAGLPHSSSSQVFIGAPDQFFDRDPMGRAAEAPYVVPWINIRNGKVWWPYGDEVPEGLTLRWWQQQATTPGIGALGVRTFTTVGAQT